MTPAERRGSTHGTDLARAEREALLGAQPTIRTWWQPSRSSPIRGDAKVGQQVEADVVDVARRAVDVGRTQGDQLESQVHGSHPGIPVSGDVGPSRL